MPGKDGTGPLGQGTNRGRRFGLVSRGQERGMGKSQGLGWRKSGGNGAGFGPSRTFGQGKRGFGLGNGACLNPQVDAANERPVSRGSSKYRLIDKLN